MTKFKLYHEPETICARYGGMLPQNIFKIKILKLARNEFHTTKFPDYGNFVVFPWLLKAKFLTFPGFPGQWTPCYKTKGTSTQIQIYRKRITSDQSWPQVIFRMIIIAQQLSVLVKSVFVYIGPEKWTATPGSLSNIQKWCTPPRKQQCEYH